MLSADAHFYLAIPFVIFMLRCVYNSLFYIWSYQTRNSVSDSSLKEWPLNCIAATDISVDVNINVEEFNCLVLLLLYSLVEIYFYLCNLYNPFAMEQTHIYPALHKELR